MAAHIRAEDRHHPGNRRHQRRFYALGLYCTYSACLSTVTAMCGTGGGQQLTLTKPRLCVMYHTVVLVSFEPFWRVPLLKTVAFLCICCMSLYPGEWGGVPGRARGYDTHVSL